MRIAMAIKRFSVSRFRTVADALQLSEQTNWCVYYILTCVGSELPTGGQNVTYEYYRTVSYIL